MLKKIMKVAVLIALAFMVFLSSSLYMGKFSPYFGTNSFSIYIPISIINAVISFLLLLLVINRQLPKPLLRGGLLFFMIGAVMASIAGLVAQPDFTPALLKHPEREHYRYALLFLNALLFAGAFIFSRRLNSVNGINGSSFFLYRHWEKCCGNFITIIFMQKICRSG